MREIAKELYVKGKDINEICTATGITRQTFYYHKKADFKKGVDWDALRLANLRSEDELENKEAMFVNTLITSFEKFLKEAGELNLDAPTLDRLYQYAKTYWSIKAPKQINEKEIALKTAKGTIEAIAILAISQKENEVAVWLGENSDEIISMVSKR
ncbi:DUF1804 family protein [Campylobacter sp. RM12920]|uniref:DUF1804 family protein n=1 Tax=Campylobacter californiensis TaxID=1032243 RepID=A0ABD4JG23_9BACT|nr:DUF1804 family protein [Campylobacter sp. RM12919]MBE2987429.1 DUF1804 family protein [Campylobacter sp. RM12920]